MWNLYSFSEITEFFDRGGGEYKLFGVSHVNNMLVFFVSDYSEKYFFDRCKWETKGIAKVTEVV